MEQGRPVNLHVSQRNNKGEVISEEPYRLVIENGQQMFEVPPGSGQFYSQNGQLIKDVSDSKSGGKDEDKDGSNFNSGAPQSHPFGPPKIELGEVKNEGQPEKVLDDHTRPDRAQQEFNAQQGKATSQTAPAKK